MRSKIFARGTAGIAASVCGLLFSALILVPARAFSESTVVGKTIAIVNNDPIFYSELEKESEPFVQRYKATAPSEDQTPDKIKELKREVLDRMIEEKLLLQEAEKKRVRVTKTEIERGIAQFKEPFSMDQDGKPRKLSQIEKAFQAQLSKEGLTQAQFNKRVEEQIMKVRLIEMEVKAKVEMPEEKEVKAFFAKIEKKIAGKPVDAQNQEEETDLVQISRYLERVTGDQVRIRHILIRSLRSSPAKERAQARKKLEGVLKRLRNGEDFSFLARKFTDDPISRNRGGDLGFVAKGDMGLPEIDKKIFSMREGQISGVIETEIGYHIIKLIEKKVPHPLEYEEVSEDLRNYLAQRSFTKKLEDYLKNLRAKASIKVNPLE